MSLSNSLEKSLVALAVSAFALPLNAATINVSETCTFADAIVSANQSTATGGCVAGAGLVNTINLPSEIFSYSTPVVVSTSGGSTALPLIESNITIEGNGAILERSEETNSRFRLLAVDSSAQQATLTLNQLTLRNGSPQNYYGTRGGAIEVRTNSRAILNQSKILGNEATNGAISIGNDAELTLNDSSISGNNTSGIYAFQAKKITVNNSLISNNSTFNFGGGIYLFYCDSLQVTNSTISGNYADANYGTAIYSQASTISLINSTIVERSVSARNGVIVLGDGEASHVSLSNTVLASDSNTNVCLSRYAGNFTLALHNSWVDKTDSSCNVQVDNGDARLAPLADNGGLTKTRAPLAGSGLIDAGDPNVCNASPVNGVDQRGEVRGNTTCFIGAVETIAKDNTPFVIPIDEDRAVIFDL